MHFRGHVVCSVFQRSVQDATLESMGDGTRLLVVDWAMKLPALYARQQSVLSQPGSYDGTFYFYFLPSSQLLAIVGTHTACIMSAI